MALMAVFLDGVEDSCLGQFPWVGVPSRCIPASPPDQDKLLIERESERKE